MLQAKSPRSTLSCPRCSEIFHEDYLPGGCVECHFAHPDVVEACLAAGVAHKVHVLPSLRQLEQCAATPLTELPHQQPVSHNLVPLIAIIQHTHRQLLKQPETCRTSHYITSAWCGTVSRSYGHSISNMLQYSFLIFSCDFCILE